MGLITKGMGAILKGVAKKTKKLGGDIKSGKFPPAPKTDIPFYVVVGATTAATIAYEKEKEKSKKKKKDKDKE